MGRMRFTELRSVLARSLGIPAMEVLSYSVSIGV